MSAPLISVVVLAYNQFDRTTQPCLESLKSGFTDAEIEFIVFDNASPDGSGTLAQAWCAQHPTVQFIQSDHNLGYAGGMNAAASHATGQWLFLVNNDTEFPAHALNALKTVLRAAPPNTAMIGPVTNAAGNGQRLYDPSKSKAQWLELGAWLNTHPTGLLLPTYRCDFFCIAIRHNAWKALNGLDTVFGMGYFEDFDFSLRLREAGHEQAITEDVFIYHQGSATFKASSQLKALLKRNKKIIQKVHGQVKFHHVRWCNEQALKWLISTANLEENMKKRLALRIHALTLDMPKSFFKKIIWKHRAKQMRQFAQIKNLSIP
jgi:GT2 family glycosyltransferase